MKEKTEINYKKKYLALLKEVRQAFARYRRAEGCSCCRDTEGHELNTDRMAKALHIPKYSDKSGWDFDRYTNRKTPQPHETK